MRVWQIASGTGERDYTSMFIENDLMFLGPGDPGPFDDESYAKLKKPFEISRQKRGALRQFALDMEPGDRVLLRQGHRVVAIGVVDEGGYSWERGLDDVHGWNLQHTRRVRWNEGASGELDKLQRSALLFGTRKQIPMFTRVRAESVLRRVADLLDRTVERPLRDFPVLASEPLDDAALGTELFGRGLSNESTEHVVAALRRQRRLRRWYVENGKECGRPTEHEVVAHMVLPLLLALGWSEQLLAVEWRKIDLAGFHRAPTNEESCSLVCEAKKMDHGLQGVLTQALRYVNTVKLGQCNRILLTQGTRFYLHVKGAKGWNERPTGYLNVEKPRLRNFDGTDAVETLLGLRPSMG